MYICSRCHHKYEERIERCPLDGKRVVRDLSGQLVGERYELKSLVGVGGMGGSVWAAWQASTKRTVAVKILPATGTIPAERFARGARIASNLNHPNITTVHDYGQTDLGDLYLVMELLEGRDLFQMSRREDISFRRVVHIFDQVLRALGHAHSRNVVHRDVKLSNLFLTPREDDEDFVKILDFGIARYISGGGISGDDSLDEVTGVHQLCGTPQYMAPEQIGFGTIGARADLYAVGIAVFRLLSGVFPFNGNSHEIFRQHLQSSPPSILDHVQTGSIPSGLDEWIMRALAKSPDDRFLDAAQMRNALQALNENEAHSISTRRAESESIVDVPDVPETETTPRAAAIGPSSSVAHAMPTRPSKRSPLSIAVVLAALSVLGVYFGLEWREDTSRSTSSTRMDATKLLVATDADVRFDDSIQSTRYEHSPSPDRKDEAVSSSISSGDNSSSQAPEASPSTTNSDEQLVIPVQDGNERQWVRINSIPSGAMVSWQGKNLGQTPFRFILPKGNHSFFLEKAGFFSLEKNIQVDTISPEEHQYSWKMRKRARRRTKNTLPEKSIQKPIPKTAVSEPPKLLDSPVPEVPKPIAPLRVHILGSEDGAKDDGIKSDSADQRPRVKILE